MTERSGLAAIVGVPQWVFHGGKDNDTDVEKGYGGEMVGSRAVVRALRAMGGKPVYTEYPTEMHVIWHRAYATDGLLAWMLASGAPARPVISPRVHSGRRARRGRIDASPQLQIWSFPRMRGFQQPKAGHPGPLLHRPRKAKPVDFRVRGMTRKSARSFN